MGAEEGLHSPHQLFILIVSRHVWLRKNVVALSFTIECPFGRIVDLLARERCLLGPEI